MVKHVNANLGNCISTCSGIKSDLQEQRSSRLHKQKEQMNRKILNEKFTNIGTESIPETAKLSTKLYDNTRTIEAEQNDTNTNNKREESNEVSLTDTFCNNTIAKVNVIEATGKKVDLVQFQERQKAVEEQNKRRKELLTKVLAVRTRQTKEEAQKLNEIREEFKKLDVSLSSDVKILRQQIEVASLEYMEAERRYYKIEKEFLNAKIVLHKKSERKEMLTEHLCAIIEENEDRKAKKLEELMNKLNLKTFEE